MKFGIAFSEASGPCLIRVEGNDDNLKALATRNAAAVAAGTPLWSLFVRAFPSISCRIQQIPEVLMRLCATQIRQR